MPLRRNEKHIQKIIRAEEDGFTSYAAELAARYVSTYPDDPEGHWHLGLLLDTLNRYQEAREVLEGSLSLVSEDFLQQFLERLGQICRTMGDFDNAERFFKEAIATAPHEAEAYLHYSMLLQALNRDEEAEKCLRTGIKMAASPLTSIYLQLGNLLTTKGQLAKAAQTYRNVLAIDSEHDHAISALQDLQLLAELRGIPLPRVDPPKQEAEHQPGNLTVNIHREFFAEIAACRKKIEYRTFTEYWEKRIENAGKPPFHLRVINGMLDNAPELTVIVERVLLNYWDRVYELHLGKVMHLKNWDVRKEAPIE